MKAQNQLKLGASVQIETENGNKMSVVYITGEGLGSGQKSALTFGLGEEEILK